MPALRTSIASVFLLPCLAFAAPDLAKLRKLNARLVPVDVEVDLGRLPASERASLARLVEAAELMNPLYLRQMWSGAEAKHFELARDESPLGREQLRAFLLHGGPWDRIDGRKPFLPRVPLERPRGGTFYPPDATKAELEAWMKTLSEAERAKAKGFFTTVRRGADGKLFTVPYSQEYQPELQRAAELLREAAELTQQPTLKDFLLKRAAAFRTNDYYPSDVAWMKLDSSIEPTLGPYEVYEDDWFNAKASFQAFLAVRDEAETARLARFGAELQEIENQLPIDPKLRNPKLGALAPIRVVNSVFHAGDANTGVQTAAFNLPNDERIARELGTKRTMLKNIQQLKFERVLVPIAGVALSAADRKLVTFDAFFTHILMHELMHGLGPHAVTGEGKTTTVREQLQESYSAIEEAKADVSGLFALQLLIDKGVLDRSLEKTMYSTFLASAFRSIRFGLSDAHGKGVALQVNTFLDAGAFKVAPDGTFSVDVARAKQTVVKLTGELMTLQASGDANKARAMLEFRALVRPPVQAVLSRLEQIPIDIAPQFVTAKALRKLETPTAAGPAGHGASL